ncbi:FecR domain-containing protein [Niabella pedocola]|uniref:FecR domain-containing protein n=1 Tax=Niabella pedocola TaxID=1752077 RepID=A0ABS8PRH5_9BACT|nr:FecR family protein [Niabella pedocola]MCD2423686.1 FecR domain-containing protein [Niabella pedocola]
MDRQEDIQELFKKYVNNDISREEFLKLLQYLSAEGREEQLSAWVRNEWQATAPGEEALPGELKALLEGLDEQLLARLDGSVKRIPGYRQRSVRSLRRKWLLTSAAIIMFLVVGAVIWYTVPRSRHASQQAAVKTHDVNPGGNRAFLAIGNGQRVVLDSNQAAVIVQNGALRYADGSLITSLNADSSHANGQPEFVVLTTPPGGQYRLTLPDGTGVWVNASSSIRYPVRFTGTRREVTLSGEAYFEVQKNPDMPFVVLSGGQELSVLGTRFNISAYPEDKRIVTTLVEGSVKILPGVGSQPRLLVPGQQSVLKDGDLSVKKVEVGYYTAWKDGLFVFNRLPVQAILPQIERWYDVQFRYPAAMERTLMWGTVSRNVMLSEILEVLALNTGWKFTLQGKTVLISPKTGMN